MIDALIARVTTAHPEFTHEEVEIFCRDFLDSMSTEKIKEETKIKRLIKYIEREFELESSTIERASSRVYSLETIPAYLFESQLLKNTIDLFLNNSVLALYYRKMMILFFSFVFLIRKTRIIPEISIEKYIQLKKSQANWEIFMLFYGSATENRTPVYGMKTRCPNH